MNAFWTTHISFGAVTFQPALRLWRRLVQAYIMHQERRILLEIEPRLLRDIGL